MDAILRTIDQVSNAADAYIPSILRTIDQVSNAADAYVPSPVPVPALITTAAEFMSEKATPPSFPYVIKDVNLGDVVFWQAVIVIFLQPLLWNVIGRFEHYTRLLSKIFLKPVIGTYAFALWIFVGGLYRDVLFVAAMESQATVEWLGMPEYRAAALFLMGLGLILVLTSFYQLGMIGTYLGDYFGILMEKRVTAFPFNCFSDPMYDGSTMLFLGKAMLYVIRYVCGSEFDVFMG